VSAVIGSVGSVTGSVSGNVVGSVGSVTGNVGGNVVGSVASVTAGVTLAASAVTAIWDKLTSALTTAGSIGKLLVDNVDAAISSRLASASYTAPDNTSITAIKAKTDNLPASPASTTNITAGTITTVTNLTNAPTAGDFTAAMKTSLNAATPAVTVSDKTGFALTSAYDFAKGNVAMTESYPTLGSTMTPAQALYGINQALSENSVSGTTMTVKKRDQSTTAKTFTLNDATSPTAITEAT
jgi:hypothetical protein